MTNLVSDFIQKHHLLDSAAKYIVALSGGADSVALLLMLRQLGFQIEAAHCNFHLRGSESDRDEQFCRNLCDQLHVPLHLAHFDTREYAQLHQVSIEMAARELRYTYFHQLAHDIGAQGICVAHHRDDSVETVLLNLIRGTGLHGLHGIQPRNGLIIRPLLCLSRQDIEQYLACQRQDYVTDSTNLVDEVARNKIRLNVLPAMREVNPSVARSIDHTARRLTEAAKALDAAMDEKRQRACTIRRLTGSDEVVAIEKKQIDSEYLLFYLLNPCGFAPEQIETMYARLHSTPTGALYESATHQLLFDRESLLLREKKTDVLPPFVIPEPGTYRYGEGMKIRVAIEDVARMDDFPYKNADWACLDADKVTFPLTLRRVGQGDTFIPFGMKGKKLLSDFMTDRKMSLFEKQAQLVLTQADGDIVWLVNLRPDNRFRVTPATRRILLIETLASSASLSSWPTLPHCLSSCSGSR